MVDGRRRLYRPHDERRDQSYFLFATTQEQLDFVRFPLGDMPKDRVRELAAEMNLVVADKPDSQDICFVPDGRYAKIVAAMRPDASQPGDIIHVDGRVLGTHDGVINYTVGQRRGLNIALGEPLFVVAIDAPRHRLIVGPRSALATHKVTLRDHNWLGDSLREGEEHAVFARVRSSRPPRPGIARFSGGVLTVDLVGGEEGVAPGQACVLYASDAAGAEILGGGFIERTPASTSSLALV